MVHPDQEFRDEADIAAKAFGELGTSIEMDPSLAKLILQMTFEDSESLPHQRIFLERWQDRVRRSGAALLQHERDELAKVEAELSGLRAQFRRNIADTVSKWKVPIKDLEGMPEDFFASQIPDKNDEMVLTSSYADYQRVMTFVQSDDVKERIHPV
jgi:Zn-dependent oligopeptidase